MEARSTPADAMDLLGALLFARREGEGNREKLASPDDYDDAMTTCSEPVGQYEMCVDEKVFSPAVWKGFTQLNSGTLFIGD